MPHSKTPGGSGASEKFQKQEAQKHGLGADNAPSHKQGTAPGEKPVASDSATSSVGVDAGTNQPGEKGLKDAVVGETGNASGQARMK